MIQAIIVDDEKLSITTLENRLRNFSNVCIKKTYTHHEQVLSDLMVEKIDVAFLDIEMPNVNGIDLAEAILAIQPSIHIIFVTAHTEYAVQAFEINSIDYLLKPVTMKRLHKTIDRITKKLETASTTENTFPSAVAINCFKELQVFYNDQLVLFKTAKVKELFAFLLTHSNTYINRDVLIETLWPEHDYKKSKIHLHTCLSHLRKTLDQLGFSNCITFKNQSYFFSLEPIYCDVFEFEKALQHVDKINDIAIATAEKATQLYTGTYMELNHYDWAFAKAQSYREQMLHLLTNIINYYQNIDGQKTLHYLQAYLKINPYSSEKMKQTMELFNRQGNRLQAIKLYQDYKQLILQELNVEPDETLEQLYYSLTVKQAK